MDPVDCGPWESSHQTHKDRYEQLLAREESSKRRYDEHMARLKESSRLQELDHARRMAELERQARQAQVHQDEMRRKTEEALQRQRMELEEKLGKLNQTLRPQGMGNGISASPYSMFGGGIQNWLDSLYGYPYPQPLSTFGHSPMSSAPKTSGGSSSPVEPKTKVRSTAKDSVTDGRASKAAPAAVSSSVQNDTTHNPKAQQMSSSARKAVLDALSKFATLKSSFTFPAALDFLLTPEGVSTPAPKLAYTPNNAPLH
ncbi:hypothetical protein FRC07_010621, partial [Ceratobasidium sp. 392]